MAVDTRNHHLFYCWGTAYQNHIPALQGGIGQRAAEAHAIHATDGSSSLSSISAERFRGRRIAFASVTFVGRMDTRLTCLLQAARKLKQLKYFGERIHVRPTNRHRHITAKSHEVPDIILTHVQRIQDDHNRAADGTKYCSIYHTPCNITARGKTG